MYTEKTCILLDKVIGGGMFWIFGFSLSIEFAAKKLIKILSSIIYTALKGDFPNEKETKITVRKSVSIEMTWN